MSRLRQRSPRLAIFTYLPSLIMTIALLVFWVIYVFRAETRVSGFAERVGVARDNSQWVILVLGCFLFALVIGGLTYQLALTLSEIRYSRKQQDFVSNITHEMKSPLAAIRLHAQTLLEEDVESGDRQRFVSYILQQQENMSTLVDNLLEASRLQARKQRLELRPVALRPLLEKFLEEAEERLRRRNLQLRYQLETGATVMATEDAVLRCINNLLDNAARFSVPGGEVRCLVTDDGSRALLAVEDDGVGIPKSELRKVFDRFYQLGHGRGGSGLGLSIVAGLVREMRGSVRAVSHEGRPGCRFEIELPRWDSARAEA